MSRIDDKFRELKLLNRKALITFVTAGDPDLETTIRIVKEMEKRGADVIELGIPYSDPIAEGPVIQRANTRALLNGLKIKDIMNAADRIRKDVKVPILYLLYYNCILQYGIKRFFEDCVKSGVDGIIIPDLPFEERSELDEKTSKYPVDIITLVSPTSEGRIEKVAKNSRGFLYCVSSVGVTGMRSEFNTDFEDFFTKINKATKIPKAIGFGISTPEHIKTLKKYCDGLIIGSAIVKKVEISTSADDAVKNVGEYIKTLREAMDEGV